VVGVDTHDPGAIVTLLATHLRDCNGEGLRGHACASATGPIAKIPRGDGDGFCLAAPLMSHGLRLCRLVRLQDETWRASTASSATLTLDLRADVHLWQQRIGGLYPPMSIMQFRDEAQPGGEKPGTRRLGCSIHYCQGGSRRIRFAGRAETLKGAIEGR